MFADGASDGKPTGSQTAIDEGCRAGAFCVTRPGVIDGLADAAALRSMLRESAA